MQFYLNRWAAYNADRADGNGKMVVDFSSGGGGELVGVASSRKGRQAGGARKH